MVPQRCSLFLPPPPPHTHLPGVLCSSLAPVHATWKCLRARLALRLQGVLLDGLAALSIAVNNASILQVAEGAVQSVMTYLSPQGVLAEPCNTPCGDSGVRPIPSCPYPVVMCVWV